MVRVSAGTPCGCGVVREVVQQGTSDRATCLVGVDRNLFHVEVPVHVFRDQVGHRSICRVGGHPGQAVPPVARQLTGREWLVLGDLGHSDVAEALSGGSLDVLEQR